MRSTTRLFSFAVVVLLAVSACSVMRGEESAGTALDDTTLTARIKAALAADPTVAATRIDVDVDKGRVTLKGTAGSDEEVAIATDIASRVPGVKGVESEIRLAEADTESKSRE
jgi:hyperosmotically inducible periplasmic protein